MYFLVKMTVGQSPMQFFQVYFLEIIGFQGMIAYFLL